MTGEYTGHVNAKQIAFNHNNHVSFTIDGEQVGLLVPFPGMFVTYVEASEPEAEIDTNKEK